MLAVLSRLARHENLAPVDKMKLYDGQEVGEWKLAQVPELKRSAEHEGMGGLGPRRIIDVLAAAAAKGGRSPDGEACLDPIATLIALKGHIEEMEIERDQRQTLLALLADVRAELDRELKDEVRKAFVPAFAERAQNLLENYLNNVEGYCQNMKLRDPVTDEDVAPDEKLMRAIEEQVGVSENAKDAFRQGVLVRIGIILRSGRPLTYRSDDQLGKAIEGYLFEQLRDVIQITVSKTNPDPEQAKRLNEVMRVMTEQRGYCPQCATAVLDYVGQLLHR
jgi:serine protein kinase